MTASSPRTVLLALSVLLALAEIGDGLRLDPPWAAWTYAALLLGGSVWLWRSARSGPVIMLGALHLIELLMLIFVFRTAEQAPPTWLFVLFVAISAAGTLAAAATLGQRSRTNAS